MIDYIKNENFSYLINIDSPYIFNGEKVPRVTHILSAMLYEDYITQWANSLGYRHKSYKITLQDAADRGSLIHDSINKYFISGVTPEDYMAIIPDEYLDTTLTGFKSFRLWFDNLENAKVIFTEKELISPYFGGTADLVLEYNNKIYLLDFKTGKNLSFKHFLQLSIYKYMLETYYNIRIDCVGIIRLDKSFIAYKDSILDLSNEENIKYINQCTQTFFALFNAYRYRLNNEYLFKNKF